MEGVKVFFKRDKMLGSGGLRVEFSSGFSGDKIVVDRDGIGISEDASEEFAGVHGELVRINGEDIDGEEYGVSLSDIEDICGREKLIEAVIFIDGNSDKAQPGKGRITDAQDFVRVVI